MIDSHAHLQDEKFDNVEKLIQNAINAGVNKIICASSSLKTSKQALEIAKKFDGVFATVGIHPEEALEWDENAKEELRGLAKNKKVVAIGETGLDYCYEFCSRTQQKLAFKEQIKLANELELPIVIHTREAVMDTIEILKNNTVNKKGVFHCCPFNRELVKEALKLDFYISIAGPVTFKNSKNAEEIINMIPLNRILIETDSPYLAPEPLRGTRNDSRNVKYIAQKISDIKNVELEEVAKVTYKNAENIFNIK